MGRRMVVARLKCCRIAVESKSSRSSNHRLNAESDKSDKPETTRAYGGFGTKPNDQEGGGTRNAQSAKHLRTSGVGYCLLSTINSSSTCRRCGTEACMPALRRRHRPGR